MKKLIPIFLMLMLAIACGKDDKEADPCENVSCEYGTCVDGSCLCDEGYEGENCAEALNAKFTGDWEMPCEGDINITAVGQQTIPTQTSTITIDGSGSPTEVSIGFTIPVVNQEITIVGTVDGDQIIFDEQEFIIPSDVIDTALDLLGVTLPISLGDIPITISGEGTLSNDELLVDIIIDGGILLNGEINCVGVKVE